MSGLDDILNVVAPAISGVAAPETTSVFSSPELGDMVQLLESFTLPTLDAGGIDGQEDRILELQAAVGELNTDGETFRSAIHDFALPGIQAASAEQQAAVAASASPTAALVAENLSSLSSDALFSQATELFRAINPDSTLEASEFVDGQPAPGEATVDDDLDLAGERPEDVLTQTTAAVGIPTTATSMPGVAPSPASLLGGLSPAGTFATSPLATTSQLASGAGGMSQAELRSIIQEAKDRLGAKKSTDAAPPARSSTFTSKSTPASAIPTAGTSATQTVPDAPATGRTVMGGTVEQSTAGRSATTTLSHSTSGSVGSSTAAGTATRGGMGGMGMMPPMSGMGGSPAGGSTKGKGDRLADLTTSNPVLTGEWLRQTTVGGNPEVSEPTMPPPTVGEMVDLNPMTKWVR